MADLHTLGLTVDDDKERASCGFKAGGRGSFARVDVSCFCTGPKGAAAPLWRPVGQRTPSPATDGGSTATRRGYRIASATPALAVDPSPSPRTPDARADDLASPPPTGRTNVTSHALDDFTPSDDEENAFEGAGDGDGTGAAPSDAASVGTAPSDGAAPSDDGREAACMDQDDGDGSAATPGSPPALTSRTPLLPPATPAAAIVATLHAELAPALATRPDAANAAAALDAAAAWAAPDARTLLRLGNALYALGEAGAAEAAYEAGLAAADDDASPDGSPGPCAALVPKLHVNLGIALEAQGMLDDAAAAYAAAVGADPGHARAHKLLGSVRYALGSYDAAAASLEAALELDPDYVDARCDLGCVLCALGRGEDAAAAFEAAVDADPTHTEALFNLAGLRRQWGEWDAAAALYGRLLDADGGHWRARLGLAVTLAGAGRADAARDELQAALRTPGTDRAVVEKELEGLKRLAATRRAQVAALAW